MHGQGMTLLCAEFCLPDPDCCTQNCPMCLPGGKECSNSVSHLSNGVKVSQISKAWLKLADLHCTMNVFVSSVQKTNILEMPEIFSSDTLC